MTDFGWLALALIVLLVIGSWLMMWIAEWAEDREARISRKDDVIRLTPREKR